MKLALFIALLASGYTVYLHFCVQPQIDTRKSAIETTTEKPQGAHFSAQKIENYRQ